jgi:WD40 repeat protein
LRTRVVSRVLSACARSPARPDTAQVWDLRTNKAVAELRGHTGSVTCVGTYQWQLASGAGFNRGLDNDTVLSVDSTIRMWDLRSMQCMWVKEVPPPPGGTPHPKGDPVLCLQLLHDKILTSHGGKDWTARVWQISR